MKLLLGIILYCITVFLVFLYASMYLALKHDIQTLRIETFNPPVELAFFDVPQELVYIPRPVPKPKFIRQVSCMAKNIYHEARGEGLDGMRYVGFVTMNRVKSSSWPDSVCDVVYQPKQFSWTINRPKVKRGPELEKSVHVAKAVIKGTVEDTSDGATHYYAHQKVNPWWAKSYQVVSKVGGHTFLK